MSAQNALVDVPDSERPAEDKDAPRSADDDRGAASRPQAPAPPGDEELWQWFASLDETSRDRAVLVQDRLWVALIRRLFQRQASSGGVPGVFQIDFRHAHGASKRLSRETIQFGKYNDPRNGGENMMPQEIVDAEMALVHGVRLADGDDPLDSLTLDVQLLARDGWLKETMSNIYRAAWPSSGTVARDADEFEPDNIHAPLLTSLAFMVADRMLLAMRDRRATGLPSPPPQGALASVESLAVLWDEQMDAAARAELVATCKPRPADVDLATLDGNELVRLVFHRPLARAQSSLDVALRAFGRDLAARARLQSIDDESSLLAALVDEEDNEAERERQRREKAQLKNKKKKEKLREKKQAARKAEEEEEERRRAEREAAEAEQRQREEEETRRRREEEARRREEAEEARRIEEAARRKAAEEEEARRIEEEARRKAAEEEEARKRAAEEEEARRKAAEEEAKATVLRSPASSSASSTLSDTSASSSAPMNRSTTLSVDAAEFVVPLLESGPPISPMLGTADTPAAAPAVPATAAAYIARLHDDVGNMATALHAIAVRRRVWQQAVIGHVAAVVAQAYPLASLEIYGSLATGLALPSSDVDLVIRGLAPGTNPKTVLTNLAARFLLHAWVQSVQTITETFMPVIKLTAVGGNGGGGDARLVKVDLTVDGPNHRGVRAAGLVRYCCAMFPVLQPITLVLKQFLVEKGLHDPFTGGLSSYGVALLVASFLQQREDRKPVGQTAVASGGVGSLAAAASGSEASADVAPGANNSNLGVLLVEFMRSYGVDFDPNRDGVSIIQGRTRFPVATIGPTPPPLVLEDPLDPGNNVGKSCFGIAQVQATFRAALASLDKCIADGQPLNMNQSVLGVVFGTRHHDSVVSFARNIWGETESVAGTTRATLPEAKRASLPPGSSGRATVGATGTAATSAEHEHDGCASCLMLLRENGSLRGENKSLRSENEQLRKELAELRGRRS